MLICSLLLLATSASAQQYIQLPACGGPVPGTVAPGAATITVDPNGQLCITGNISVVVPTPPAANFPQPSSVVVTTVAGVVSGAYADGALVTLGAVGEAAYSTIGTSGDVIALLKGIFANVITPVAVSGNLAVSSPLGVNIASTTPINVTVSSPLNVTFTPPSPQQITLPASPIGVGVTNPVVLSGSPVSVGIAGPTPLNTTLVAIPGTPLNVTLPGTPITVILSNSTVAVSTSPIGVNIASSPVNMTLVSSPLNVTQAQTPQNVTLAASPLNVTATMGTPLNVTLVAVPGTPISVVQSQTPQNVTISNTPLNVTLASSPLNVSIVGSPQSVVVATPNAVWTSLPIPSAVIAHTATTAYAVTAAVVGLGVTPGIIGVHQLAGAYCTGRGGLATPQVLYLQLFSGTSTEMVLGTAKPKMIVAIAGTPLAIGTMPTLPPPGAAFTAISFAVAQGPTTLTAGGSFVDCTFAYN